MVDNKDDPNGFFSVRIHRDAWDKLGKISEALSAKASAGEKIPVRFDLGRARLLDQMISFCIREWKLEV